MLSSNLPEDGICGTQPLACFGSDMAHPEHDVASTRRMALVPRNKPGSHAVLALSLEMSL